MSEKMDHAVVVGGSVAGLLAARVLVDHARQVTVLDRDVLPDGADRRPGVPQGAHVHALLPGGGAIIERLLPGTSADLVAAGCPVLDVADDVAWLTPAGLGIRFRSSLTIHTGTRALLESVVRRKVLDLPGISNRGAAIVRGLTQDGGRVRGVRLDSGEVIDADLVVDASGRASRAPAWLAALGCDTPPETVVDANLGYATQMLERASEAIPEGWAGYVQVAPPEHLRGGIAFPIEGGRWLLTLVGTGGDHPPRDPDGFAAFARSLRDPMLAELLDAARPVGPVAVFGATSNRFRHYERVRELPSGFIAVGDAACAFNPVYGQGMSAAAMAAVALSTCLQRDPTPARLTRSFPPAFKAAVKVPWMLATAADVEVAGIRAPLPVRAVNRYVARVMAASTDSERTRMKLLQVMGLTRPPAVLFAPRVMADVLRPRPVPRHTAQPLPTGIPAGAGA